MLNNQTWRLREVFPLLKLLLRTTDGELMQKPLVAFEYQAVWSFRRDTALFSSWFVTTRVLHLKGSVCGVLSTQNYIQLLTGHL